MHDSLRLIDIKNDTDGTQKSENMKLYARLQDMYLDYLIKLQPYNLDFKDKNKKELLDIAVNEVAEMYQRRDVDILVIADIDTSRQSGYIPLGFAFIGTAPNAYGMDDIYIQEFYIAEHKKGIGRRAVWLVLKKYKKAAGKIPSDITLFVLEENFPARMFWKNVMEDYGYTDLAKDGTVLPPDESRFEPTQAELKFEYWRKQDENI